MTQSIRRLRALTIAGLAILLLALSFTAKAQNEGRILGTVSDSSGGSVVGAKVQITNVDTGIARSLDSNEAGEYVAPNLQPGLYTMTVQAAGFKKIQRTGIRIEVGKDARIDFTLQPGDVQQTVEVTEEIPLVETTNDTLGGSFANKAINDLPLNGRDFQNLVTLRPGVQRYPGGGFLSISSNGNRPEDNNFIVDGTDNNDPYYATTVINAEGVQGTPATHLPIDAIQEFNAEENPPAEYGWKPGAIVNVGLKSGTNDYHGTAYYFHRNNAFDARNFFNSATGPQKPLRLHQFGATVGAPIIKNKLFYFVAYEGVRDLVGNSEIVQSPDTVSLGGDATNSLPDAIAAVQTQGLTPSPLSLTLAKLFPANAGSFDSANPQNLPIGFPNRNREDNGLVKVDYHLTDKQALSGRYFIGDSIQTERDIAVLQPIWQSQATTRAQVLGANWTWAASSRWTNQFKFGFNRFNQSIVTVDANVDPQKYGINTGVTTPVNFGMPEIAVNGFTSLGGNHGWPLLTTPNQTFQFADTVAYIRGKHAFKFGGEFRRGSTDNVRDRYGKGRFRFEGDGAFAGSTPLEDFVAGFPAVGRLFVGNSERHVSIKSFGAFFQDDWRISDHFTINAGLRYDLSTVIKERDNLLGNFDPNQGLLQVGQQIGAPYNGDHNNFGPRLGLVWDMFGKSKTVIRAGASIIYEIPHISIFIGQNGVDNASTAGLNVIPTGANGVSPGGGKILASSNDFTTLNWTAAGPVFTATTPDCSVSPCSILAVNRNLRTPYVTTWNLNVQQQITSTASLTVGYVADKGTKLYSVFDINQVDQNSAAEIACGHCEQAGRPLAGRFPFLGVINYLTNGYESKYNGLQASYTQRLWHGVSFLAGYTWAHALDQASLNRSLNPQNSLDPAAEYGNSDLDIRHRFTLALSYEVPGIKSWGQMLQGWQLNSIVTFQTGLPWGVVDGFVNGDDISLTGEFADRWNFFGNPSDFSASHNGPIPFFQSGAPGPADNPANFAINNASCTAHASATALGQFGCYVKGSSVLAPPDAGHFGTMGRNLFRGPGYDNWDFSVVKTWSFRERFGVQLRGEFFNILNHPNFTNPYGVGGQLGNVDPSVPGSFGFASATPDVAAANPVIGSGGPRNIQLGLKLRF